jgi:glutathione S-transferase
MMILRTAPASPFGRKVRLAASLLDLESDIGIERADPMEPADSLRRQNPLGKIPVLILEDGTTLFDSRVIVEYLDHRAGGGGRIIPAHPAARFASLTLQALCDGLMDASILQVYEGRWRSADRHEPKWLDHQAGKVARALSRLEAAPPDFDGRSAISRWRARWPIGISDLAATGAPITRGSSLGSMLSRRGCRPSRRRAFRRERAVLRPSRRDQAIQKAPGDCPGPCLATACCGRSEAPRGAPAEAIVEASRHFMRLQLERAPQRRAWCQDDGNIAQG